VVLALMDLDERWSTATPCRRIPLWAHRTSWPIMLWLVTERWTGWSRPTAQSRRGADSSPWWRTASRA